MFRPRGIRSHVYMSRTWGVLMHGPWKGLTCARVLRVRVAFFAVRHAGEYLQLQQHGNNLFILEMILEFRCTCQKRPCKFAAADAATRQPSHKRPAYNPFALLRNSPQLVMKSAIVIVQLAGIGNGAVHVTHRATCGPTCAATHRGAPLATHVRCNFCVLASD